MRNKFYMVAKCDFRGSLRDNKVMDFLIDDVGEIRLYPLVRKVNEKVRRGQAFVCAPFKMARNGAISIQDAQ